MQENNNEIDLLFLWQTILKRKGMIFLGFIISILIAVGYTYLTPPVFEAKELVAIGQIQDQSQKPMLIEQPELVMQKLSGKYANLTAEKDKKGASNVIIFKAQGNSPSQANELLQQAAEDIISSHNEKFNALTNDKLAYITKLNNDLESINTQIQVLDNNIKLQSTSNSALAAILAIQKDQLERQRMFIEKEQIEKKMLLSEIQNYPTKVIRNTDQVVTKLKPKPVSSIVIVIAGVILSVFLVLALENLPFSNKN